MAGFVLGFVPAIPTIGTMCLPGSRSPGQARRRDFPRPGAL